jgi:ribosomal-protein-alanine N-acetyltransferase
MDASTLETQRLQLRPLMLSDVDFVFQHFSDPEVTRYLLDEAPLQQREEAQQLIEFFTNPQQTSNRWGLWHKADARLIGTCGYHHWDKQRLRAEIGYDLSPTYWLQGLMAEAVRAALDYGFAQMKLHRVEALVYVGHPRSARVLEKLGFQREGTLRDYFTLNGQFYDHWMYSLLSGEWDYNPSLWKSA